MVKRLPPRILSLERATNPEGVSDSSTREVRGRIVHWQANKWLVLVAHRLSIASQIFQELLGGVVYMPRALSVSPSARRINAQHVAQFDAYNIRNCLPPKKLRREIQ